MHASISYIYSSMPDVLHALLLLLLAVTTVFDYRMSLKMNYYFVVIFSGRHYDTAGDLRPMYSPQAGCPSSTSRHHDITDCQFVLHVGEWDMLDREGKRQMFSRQLTNRLVDLYGEFQKRGVGVACYPPLSVRS